MMAFYIHIGCELTGRDGSNDIIDRWIHAIRLSSRLRVMEMVIDL